MQNSKDNPKKSKVKGVKHISEVMQNAFKVLEAKKQMNKAAADAEKPTSKP